MASSGINLAKAYVQIVPSAEGIQGSITGLLDGEASSAGVSAGSNFTKSMGSAIGTGMKTVAGVSAMALTGTVALGKALVSNAKDAAAYGDNVDKLSQKIGISTQAFQEWDYVFSQNGTDISILQTGMKKLSETFTDAANGSSSAVEKFNAIGLSIEDLKGLSQEDMFSAIIAQLQEMPPSAERTAAATDLLGRSATELAPLLNQTADETAALKDQAHALGLVMSEEGVKQSAAFSDSMDNLSRAFEGAKNKIGTEFMPGLTDIANGFANLIAGNEGAKESIINGFQSIGESVQEVIPRVIEMFGTLIEAVAEIAPEIIESLVNGLLDMLPTLVPVATKLISTLVGTLIEMLPEIFEAGVKIITELVNSIAQMLPELIPQAVNAILTIVDTLIDNIDLVIDAGINLIIGLAEGLINAIPVLVEKAPEIVISIVSAIIQNLPRIATAGFEIIVALINAIINAIPKLLDIGRRIVEGLWDGIKGAWSWFTDGVSNLFGGFVNGVCNFFGIHSPSKLFAEIGEYCVMGFDEAFDDFGSGALDEVQDTVDKINEIEQEPLDAAATVVSGVNGSYGAGTTVTNGDIVLNVYGAQGQDVDDLADIIMQKLTIQVNRQAVVYG